MKYYSPTDINHSPLINKNTSSISIVLNTHKTNDGSDSEAIYKTQLPISFPLNSPWWGGISSIRVLGEYSDEIHLNRSQVIEPDDLTIESLLLVLYVDGKDPETINPARTPTDSNPPNTSQNVDSDDKKLVKPKFPDRLMIMLSFQISILKVKTSLSVFAPSLASDLQLKGIEAQLDWQIYFEIEKPCKRDYVSFDLSHFNSWIKFPYHIEDILQHHPDLQNTDSTHLWLIGKGLDYPAPQCAQFPLNIDKISLKHETIVPMIRRKLMQDFTHVKVLRFTQQKTFPFHLQNNVSRYTKEGAVEAIAFNLIGDSRTYLPRISNCNLYDHSGMYLGQVSPSEIRERFGLLRIPSKPVSGVWCERKSTLSHNTSQNTFTEQIDLVCFNFYHVPHVENVIIEDHLFRSPFYEITNSSHPSVIDNDTQMISFKLDKLPFAFNQYSLTISYTVVYKLEAQSNSPLQDQTNRGGLFSSFFSR